jgi:hypothetical protein
MRWLNRQIDKILDAWEMKDVEDIEAYGDEESGYVLEYGSRIKEFESSGELISFYNERLKDLLDREPVSVIGNIDESDKSRLRKSEGEAAVRGDKWAVDVYDTVANYMDRAGMKALDDATFSTSLTFSENEDIEDKINKELRKIEHTNPRERMEHYLITALSGTITQVIAESEMLSKEATDLEYFIEEIDELGR